MAVYDYVTYGIYSEEIATKIKSFLKKESVFDSSTNDKLVVKDNTIIITRHVYGALGNGEPYDIKAVIWGMMDAKELKRAFRESCCSFI